jgi:hypothetical protein
VIVPRFVAVNPVALRITNTNAATNAANATSTCAGWRLYRGVKASISTPTSAAPNRISIGMSAL